VQESPHRPATIMPLWVLMLCYQVAMLRPHGRAWPAIEKIMQVQRWRLCKNLHLFSWGTMSKQSRPENHRKQSDQQRTRTKTWAFVIGNSSENARGMYGNLRVRSGSNVHGGGAGAASLIDGAGNLWIFGGSGYDGDGNLVTSTISGASNSSISCAHKL